MPTPATSVSCLCSARARSSPSGGLLLSRAFALVRPLEAELSSTGSNTWPSKEKVNVAIFDHGVWKAWQPSAAYEQFPDLYQGLDPEDFAQVRPLLFGKKEQDSNVNRKAFQDDANKLAKAFAKESRNEEIMDLRRHIDEDTRDVLSVAATRMKSSSRISPTSRIRANRRTLLTKSPWHSRRSPSCSSWKTGLTWEVIPGSHTARVSAAANANRGFMAKA